MSRFPTNCLTRTTIQSNSTILAGIEACQVAANTTFCYPPNGTRICAPAEYIPFYWPPSYYHSDSKVSLEYEVDPWVLLLLSNTGNHTQDFTPYMFDSKATDIPGVQNEKTIQMYLHERRFDDKIDPMNLKMHEGPTLVLVKTAEWPTRTSASNRATATEVSHYDSDSDSDSDDDDKRKLRPGVIAAIVVTAFIFMAIVLLYMLRRGRCSSSRKVKEVKMSKKEQAHIIEQGLALMEPRGTTTKTGTGKEKVVSANIGSLDSDNDSESIDRLGEARVKQMRQEVESVYDHREDVPTPKYTP